MSVSARVKHAKLFMNGRSQAVRLPAEFRFPGDEVQIRRDAATGEVILSAVPVGWHRLIEARKIALSAKESEGFLEKRDQGEHKRDPFEGWTE